MRVCVYVYVNLLVFVRSFGYFSFYCLSAGVSKMSRKRSPRLTSHWISIFFICATLTIIRSWNWTKRTKQNTRICHLTLVALYWFQLTHRFAFFGNLVVVKACSLSSSYVKCISIEGCMWRVLALIAQIERAQQHRKRERKKNDEQMWINRLILIELIK